MPTGAERRCSLTVLPRHAIATAEVPNPKDLHLDHGERFADN